MSRWTRRSVLASPAAPLLAQTGRRPPNILLILSDDHSAPYLGCYGADWMKTPNLDRFASEGMRGERFFCAAPQCVPSRTAFLTGRSPVGARMGRFSSPLPADVATAPELLRTKGYATGVCGRYFHLNGLAQPNPVSQRTYEKYGLRTWDKRVDYMKNSPQGQTAENLDEFLTNTGKGKPFFFWINYSDPHHVWDKNAGAVDPAKIRLPGHLPDLPGVRGDLARYCGEVERMDGFFGAAMQVLKKHAVEEDTLVLFLGDNGMAFPHGKGSLYDPGLNVPMLARWPGRIKPGSVTRSLVSGEDVTPTFLAAAGVASRPEMTGRSALGLLTGGEYQPRQNIFGQRIPHGNSPFTPTTKASTFDLSRCVRSDRWKLIYNCTPQMEYAPVDSARDPGWVEMVAAQQEGKLDPKIARAYFTRPRPVLELYDLERDPFELDNVAGRAENAEVQRELTEALQEKMTIDFDYLPPPLQN